MFVVINQLSVKPEFAAEVEAAFVENNQGLAQEPGFCGFRFLRPLKPAEQPFIVEVVWQDQAAFEAWKTSAHFKQSHAGMGRFREAFYAPPRFSHHEVVQNIPLAN